MPATRIATASLTDDVVTLGVVSVAGLRPGLTVQIDGLGHPYDGGHTLTAVDTETVTVEYARNHADVAEADVVGQLTLPVTWADTGDVEQFLGVAPATETDELYLESAVSAANDYAYERRAVAGYDDLPDIVPSARVKLGVVLKAGELYRARGSVDGFQSFNNLEPAVPISTAGEIARLLGIGKPAVA